MDGPSLHPLLVWLLIAGIHSLLVSPATRSVSSRAVRPHQLSAALTKNKDNLLSNIKKSVGRDDITKQFLHDGYKVDSQRNLQLGPPPTSSISPPTSPTSPTTPIPPSSSNVSPRPLTPNPPIFPTRRPSLAPSTPRRLTPAPQDEAATASSETYPPSEECTPLEEVQSFVENFENGNSLSVNCPPGVYGFQHCTCNFYIEGTPCTKCHMCHNGDYLNAQDCSNIVPYSSCAARDCNNDKCFYSSASFDEYVQENSAPQGFLWCNTIHGDETEGPEVCTEFSCPRDAENYLNCRCKVTIEGRECSSCGICDEAGSFVGYDCSNVIERFSDGTCGKRQCTDNQCHTSCDEYDTSSAAASLSLSYYLTSAIATAIGMVLAALPADW